MKRPGKLRLRFVIIAAILCLVGFATTYCTSRIENRAYHGLQYDAAVRMASAQEYLKQVVLSLGIELEADDLNRTGLIGPEFTELTTTPGNVDAKRTSLNPNFAAAMIRYFHDAGLEPGDTVAIGTSGSFPGLLIAAVTAATQMGLETRVIASCGSSMHGATRVDFNIFDILKHLKEGGYAEFELLGVSPGGSNDQGKAILDGILYFDTQELALSLCEATGAEVLLYDDLADNIQRRLELYGEGVDLFINVGGASPNCGSSSYTLNFPQGLVLDPPTIPTTPYRGLSYEYSARGVPVLNLLNVRLLAQENGMAYDSVPMEQPGFGGVYVTVVYSRIIMWSTIVLSIGVLAWGIIDARRRRKHEQ